MPGSEDNPADRHQGDPRESADRMIEEILRQIGVEILDEPVPERLRRVLRPKGGSGDGNTANDSQDDPPSRGDEPQRRDDDPSG